jgi:hypothetical protein
VETVPGIETRRAEAIEEPSAGLIHAPGLTHHSRIIRMSG